MPRALTMGRREIQYHLPAIDPDPPDTPDELRLSNVSGLLSGQKHVIFLGDVRRDDVNGQKWSDSLAWRILKSSAVKIRLEYIGRDSSWLAASVQVQSTPNYRLGLDDMEPMTMGLAYAYLLWKLTPTRRLQEPG